MRITQSLVEGVDVWLNTPRRPWEASGTSGMKVLANGGLNLSELDGWWAEAYAPDVGWAIGDGKNRGDDPAWDAAEATTLYEILERDVIPSFYDRDEEGIPHGWVTRIRESMARLTGHFPRTGPSGSTPRSIICRSPRRTFDAQPAEVKQVSSLSAGRGRWLRIGTKCGSEILPSRNSMTLTNIR